MWKIFLYILQSDSLKVNILPHFILIFRNQEIYTGVLYYNLLTLFRFPTCPIFLLSPHLNFCFYPVILFF